jgi:uncharacterized membrane protein YhaH (DUF805 family)
MRLAARIYGEGHLCPASIDWGRLVLEIALLTLIAGVSFFLSQVFVEHRPAAAASIAALTSTRQKQYGGMVRGWYFLRLLGVTILQRMFQAARQDAAFLGSIIATALWFGLAVPRLQNIGMSGWWSLLVLVPIANIILGLRCLVYQEGYEDTSKLDRTGTIIGWTLAGVFLAITLTLIGIIASIPSHSP